MLQNGSNLVVVKCILACKFAIIAIIIVWQQGLIWGLYSPGYVATLCCTIRGERERKEMEHDPQCYTDTFRGLCILSQGCHSLHCITVGESGTISVEQSSCCSTETRDDSAHFHWRTEETYSPLPGAVVTFSWFWRGIQNCRLTYLLTYSDVIC